MWGGLDLVQVSYTIPSSIYDIQPILSLVMLDSHTWYITNQPDVSFNVVENE